MKLWKTGCNFLGILVALMLCQPAFAAESGTVFRYDTFFCRYFTIVIAPFGGCTAPLETPSVVMNEVAKVPAQTIQLPRSTSPSLYVPQVLGVATSTLPFFTPAQLSPYSAVPASAPFDIEKALSPFLQLSLLQQQYLVLSNKKLNGRLDSLSLLMRGQSDRDSDRVSRSVNDVRADVTKLQRGELEFSTAVVRNAMALHGTLLDSTGAAGSAGQLLQSTGAGVVWVATSTLGIVSAGGATSSGSVTSVSLVAPVGFSVSGSPVTSSGALTLNYASGYEGLRTASSTNWNEFYTTPSNRITAGTGLSWTANTLQVIDNYLLNSGDTISGHLTFSGSAANIALGTNYLSGDGGDEGVYVDANGQVGIGTSTPFAKLAVVESSPQIVGGELLTNGTFSGSAAGWVLGSCATYSSGYVTATRGVGCNPNDMDMSSSFVSNAGTTYALTFTLSNVSDELVGVFLSNNISYLTNGPYTNGTYTVYFTADFTGVDEVIFSPENHTEDGTWTIDNVSLTEVVAPTAVLAVKKNDGSSLLLLGDNNGQNVAVGQSIQNTTFGVYNALFGAAAGHSMVDAYNNSFFGALAGYSNNTGNENTFVGKNAGFSNTNGSSNIFIGANAGLVNTTAGQNIFIGYNAGRESLGGDTNIFFGLQSGWHNVSGSNNVYVGLNTGVSNTSGSYNVFMGDQTGTQNKAGEHNTFIGAAAGSFNEAGYYNTLIGDNAGYNLNTSTSTGANTILGYNAAAGLVSGINNTIIGANVVIASSTLSNNIIIADGSGNQRITVNNAGLVGIGTSTGDTALAVAGESLVSGQFFVGNFADNDGVVNLTSYAGVTTDALASLEDRFTNFSTNVVAGVGVVMELDPDANYPTGLVQGIGSVIETRSGNSRNLGEIRGGYSTLRHAGSGTITNMYGHYISVANSGGGTLTNTYGLYVGDISQGTQTNTPYSIYASDGNSYNYFAGNVAIGSTAALAPVAALAIQGGTATTSIFLANNSSDARIVFSNVSGSNFASLGQLSGGLSLSGSGDPVVTSHLFITDTGNIGLGTTTPGSTLVLSPGASTSLRFGRQSNDATVWAKSATGNESRIIVRAETGVTYFGDVDGTSGAVSLRTNGNDVVRITSGGNFGIGTTSPGSKLSVTGTMQITGISALASTTVTNLGVGTTSPSAQFTTTGTVRLANFGAGTLQTDASGNLSVSSDERLKDIQGDYTAGLTEVLGLQPILYKWNATSGLEQNSVSAGFSAQNVRDFLPAAVGEDSRGYLTLSDRSILAAVVNAVHELWDKVQGIDVRTTENAAAIDVLKQENDALKARLEALEANGNAVHPNTEPPHVDEVVAPDMETGSSTPTDSAEPTPEPVIPATDETVPVE